LVCIIRREYIIDYFFRQGGYEMGIVSICVLSFLGQKRVT
jgi:hypothetical protein